jgi:membrane-associated phospholipid phosphatase
MRVFVIIYLFFLFCLINSYAQDSINKPASISTVFLNDASTIAGDFFSFYTEPLHFSTSDWLFTAGAIGTTFLLISIDETVKNKIGRNTIKSINKDFWDIPTTYGITPYAIAFSLSTYTIGLFLREEDIRITGRLLCESLLISGAGIMVVRYLAGRVRPYYETGAWDFRGLQIGNEFQSFPSGHTSVAFALSTVLAERIDNNWARLAFYGMASLTAYARVINNQHFLSDVVWGALLGFGTGIYVVNKEEGRSENKFSIQPYLNGIGMRYNLK